MSKTVRKSKAVPKPRAMTRAEAEAKALKFVLGPIADEFAAAKRAFDAGQLEKEQYEPVRDAYNNTLERRRDQVRDAIDELMRGGSPVPKCQAGTRAKEGKHKGKLVRCTEDATMTVEGKHFCAPHGRLAPRSDAVTEVLERLRGGEASP